MWPAGPGLLIRTGSCELRHCSPCSDRAFHRDLPLAFADIPRISAFHGSIAAGTRPRARDYLAPMAGWLLLRSMPHLRLLVRVLMVVLTVGGVPGHGAALGAHCAQHSSGATGDAAMAMTAGRSAAPSAAATARTAHRSESGQSASGSVLAASGHQCPHCPPAECATAIRCASGPSTQSAPGAGPAVPGLAERSIRGLAAAPSVTSIPHAPGTAPPQAAA
jgi:hypothetical protein